jgi:hypothetical protein
VNAAVSFERYENEDEYSDFPDEFPDHLRYRASFELGQFPAPFCEIPQFNSHNKGMPISLWTLYMRKGVHFVPEGC